jgi:hypothetical protein
MVIRDRPAIGSCQRVVGWSSPPVNLTVHWQEGHGWQCAMGKCKVCIRRLTLAPGAIVDAMSHEEKDADFEETRWILDRKCHHRVMEVSVASSSTWRSHLHIHVVESQLRGRFWAVDCE